MNHLWVATYFIIPWPCIRLFLNDESSIWHIHFCRCAVSYSIISGHQTQISRARSEWRMQWSIDPCCGYVGTNRIITGLVLTTACRRTDWMCSQRSWLHAYTCSVAEPPRLLERHDALIWYCLTEDCCFSTHAF